MAKLQSKIKEAGKNKTVIMNRTQTQMNQLTLDSKGFYFIISSRRYTPVIIIPRIV